MLPIIQGLFLFPFDYSTALSLNHHFESDKDTFPEFAKKVLSDFSVSNDIWESLNDDVKSELLKLGYKSKS